MNGRQWIGHSVPSLPTYGQAAIAVPNQQPIMLIGAKPANVGQSVFMLVGLNPQAGEACSNMLP